MFLRRQYNRTLRQYGRTFLRPLIFPTLLLAFAFASSGVARAQQATPLTSAELVQLVRQLPARPALKETIIQEIRRRGISFPLTSGLRSLVATKSGNDADLRRTLEEAERRRTNPTEATLPPAAEGEALLQQARTTGQAAAEAMPDFVVKQLITRSYARGTTRNWVTSDRLALAVSYRAEEGGEKYRLLAVNGLPTPVDQQEKGYGTGLGGTISTGEYVSMLSSLFAPESRTEFKMVDTDTLRNRRTIIFEYAIERKNSKQTIKSNDYPSVTVGHRGRVWIDRENSRVLRLESSVTEIPEDYPIRAAGRTVDYAWVTIAGREYLLPARAQVELTATQNGQLFQTRNDIHFRNYQKYGSEVRIIDDEEVEDESGKPEPPKPESPKPEKP